MNILYTEDYLKFFFCYLSIYDPIFFFGRISVNYFDILSGIPQ